MFIYVISIYKPLPNWDEHPTCRAFSAALRRPHPSTGTSAPRTPLSAGDCHLPPIHWGTTVKLWGIYEDLTV